MKKAITVNGEKLKVEFFTIQSKSEIISEFKIVSLLTFVIDGLKYTDAITETYTRNEKTKKTYVKLCCSKTGFALSSEKKAIEFLLTK